jgi:hypothetical protein
MSVSPSFFSCLVKFSVHNNRERNSNDGSRCNLPSLHRLLKWWRCFVSVVAFEPCKKGSHYDEILFRRHDFLIEATLLN